MFEFDLVKKTISNKISVAEKIISFRFLVSTTKIICKTLSKLIIIDF